MIPIKKLPLIAVVMTIVFITLHVKADTITVYNDRTAFTSHTGTSITDDYSNPNYFIVGTQLDPGLRSLTDAEMSSVLNQTKYETLTFLNLNLLNYPPTVPGTYYCAGCNGEFRLDFTSTTVGTANGVFGAGFDIVGSIGASALVTFGDGSSNNYALPNVAFQTVSQFWGITASQSIRSIQINLTPNNPSTFGLDNLTIGSPVPEPTTMLLLGTGLAGLAGATKRRRRV